MTTNKNCTECIKLISLCGKEVFCGHCMIPAVWNDKFSINPIKDPETGNKLYPIFIENGYSLENLSSIRINNFWYDK